MTINAYGECSDCKGPVRTVGAHVVDSSEVEVVTLPTLEGGPKAFYGLVGFIHWPMPAGMKLAVNGSVVEAAPGMRGHRLHSETCRVPFNEPKGGDQ